MEIRKQNDDKVYECACGSVIFYLHKDGRAQCAGCEDFFTDINVQFPQGIPEIEGQVIPFDRSDQDE